MDTKSKLYKALKNNGGPFFDQGFRIIESIDLGMGKHCILESSGVQLIFVYDKGPIHVDVCSLTKIYYRSDKRHGDSKWLDIIHLVNYLRDSEKIYIHPKYYWQEKGDCEEQYIKYYAAVFQNYYALINKFMNEISYESYQEFVKYFKKENSKIWNK